MNRRNFSIILLAMLCSSVAFPALAEDGESSHDDSRSDSDQSGHGSGDEPDEEGDDKSGDDNDDEVQDDDNGSGGDDHDDARDAVDANEVLPLRQILALLSKRGDYTVIDVKLQRSGTVLRYVLKCIDHSGAVLKIVFDAKTGAMVN